MLTSLLIGFGIASCIAIPPLCFYLLARDALAFYRSHKRAKRNEFSYHYNAYAAKRGYGFPPKLLT